MPLSVAEFVNRWKINALSERGGAQSHFIDLCDMLGESHPAAADPTGERYTFEKPVSKVYGGYGFADVWLRDHFAWEYKRSDKKKHKDLRAAYKQLNDYREDLLNPPLLVVCDMNVFEIHTNFTSTSKRVYSFTLDDLNRNQVTATCPLPPLTVLRSLFGDTGALRPNRTDAFVTQEAAKVFARLAERLEIEKRSHTDTPIYTREEIAHFLMRLLFCLFADSIELLPKHLFRTLIQSDDRFLPRKFLRKLKNLFQAMSEPDGIFGEHTIKYFNGGLFDTSSVIELDTADLGILYEVSKNYNWAHVAPEIFGTLFERSLNKERRSLIGAHYTSKEDILLLIEPVLMQPLERRWAEVKANVLAALESAAGAAIESGGPSFPASSERVGSASAAEDKLRGDPSSPSELASGTGGDPSSPVVSSPAKVGRAATLDRPAPSLLRSNKLAEDKLRGDPSSPVASSPAKVGRAATPNRPAHSLLRSNKRAEELLAAWIDELTAVRVLDPACGSGNFLYLALRRMLDLWFDAQKFAAEHNISMVLPKMVSPSQLYGIETEFYAHELASIVVWIGFLQWKHEHGVIDDREPILQKLDNIQHADAIMRYDAEGKPYEPEWPAAEYIVGNPPFLGGKLLRRELGDRYVDNVFALYKGRVKAESDLVVYWFEKARAQMQNGLVTRVGLLATQAIRGGANRAVLERIQQTGVIFWAWSDRKWLLQGAAVHVSMVGFERTTADGDATGPSAEGATIYQPGAQPQGSVPPEAQREAAVHVSMVGFERATADGDATGPSAEGATIYQPGAQPQGSVPPEAQRAEGPTYILDGQPVPFINPDLTTGSNTSAAFRLKENAGICFMGTTKVGAFDIDHDTAAKMLSQPENPNGRPNADVVKPWMNSLDIARRPRGMFVIDFGTDTSEADAALYEMPFQYLKHHVEPIRKDNKRETYSSRWWLHGEARGDMRRALQPLRRFILTPGVAKHRIFLWAASELIPDHALFVFAREDDYFFGVLHSSIHELWALTRGTQLESRPRYTPDSTFDTFPFPWPPGKEPTEADSPTVKAIADAARELVRLRDNWLNPPNASESDLKDRTLTKLYNKRASREMTWLDNAHRTLDEAVFAAYGWPSTLTGQEILSRLLALNHERAARQGESAARPHES